MSSESTDDEKEDFDLSDLEGDLEPVDSGDIDDIHISSENDEAGNGDVQCYTYIM